MMHNDTKGLDEMQEFYPTKTAEKGVNLVFPTKMTKKGLRFWDFHRVGDIFSPPKDKPRNRRVGDFFGKVPFPADSCRFSGCRKPDVV
jgi:hypothetical protein